MPSAEAGDGNRQTPWSSALNGLNVRVRLTPRASRDAVEGIAALAGAAVLLARVRAVPEKGAANAALERLVAQWLGVPPGTVAVRSGAKSRLKTVLVSGPPDALERRIATAVAALPR